MTFEEEIKLLKNANGKYTITTIAKTLGKSPAYVGELCRIYKIKVKYEKIPWSDKEIEYLKANYSKDNIEQIALKLERTKASVESRARYLNLTGEKKIKEEWSDEELKYLEKYYSRLGVNKVAKNLGKSPASIKYMACKLKLKIYDGTLSFNCVANSFNVTYKVVLRWYTDLDMPALKKSRDRQNFYQIDVEEFWKWAETHKDIINWSGYERHSLLPEPEFVREAVANYSMKNAHKRISESEKQEIINAYKRGISEDRLSEKYFRSPSSIKHILKGYRKEVKSKK